MRYELAESSPLSKHPSGGAGFGESRKGTKPPRSPKTLEPIDAKLQPGLALKVARKIQVADQFLREGKLKEAEQCYRSLIKARTIDRSVYTNLGVICGYQKRFAEMERWLLLALQVGDTTPAVLNNLGVALREQDRLEEALQSFREGLKLDPKDPDLQLNLACALSETGDLQEAADLFAAVVATRPHNAMAHANFGRCLLMMGKYERGWEENEWRLHTPIYKDDQLPPGLPSLEPGQSVERLLLWREQGVGDQVLFCSLLGAARRLAPTLQVRVDHRLVPLLARSFPTVSMAASGVEREPIATLEESWDAQLALGSLPLHLDPHWKGAAQQGGAFLKADATRCQELRRALAPAKGLLCGISWHSNGQRGQEKSIALPQLAEALAMPGVQLVSLQYGNWAAQIAAEPLVMPPPAGLDPTEDLDGLAALIASCDLVISISNTTVHLAGGLGVPTWVLVQSTPDWRWGMEGERCLWYDSVRLFRQRVAGDWAPVLERVREALREQVEGTPAPSP